ncbi:MAG: DUF47 domain-containing protein [Gemmatimonadota bacterium]
MFRRLLPRETSFFDFFEQHAATTVRGCREFLELATTSTDIPARAVRIKAIESEADTITHHCVEALHKTFITPIERDDIHRLISRMDDIMDFVETAADQCALYNIEQMTPEARGLAEVLLRATEQVELAVKGLRDLKHAEAISAICIDVHRLENEGDQLLRKAVAKLFDGASDPITIIKWKEIYENLENATDMCESVANVIEGVILENA